MGMEFVQINPMGACIAGIAAIGAFALVCFVWRHRIRNAAVAILAVALALVAIPKNGRQAIGRAGSPLSAAMPRDGSVETPHISAVNVSETLDGFGVTSPAFFSFGGSGDTEND